MKKEQVKSEKGARGQKIKGAGSKRGNVKVARSMDPPKKAQISG